MHAHAILLLKDMMVTIWASYVHDGRCYTALARYVVLCEHTLY